MPKVTTDHHARTFNVAHAFGWRIEANYEFIFLPIGYMYNNYLNDARVGDTIKFVKGKTRTIRDIGFIDIHSFLFRNLCWQRYGCSAEKVLRQWELNARSEGYTKGAIDEDKAVMIWYKVDEERGIYVPPATAKAKATAQPKAKATATTKRGRPRTKKQ